MLLDAGLGVDAAAVVAAVGSAAAVEGAGAAERAEDVVAAAAVERVGAVVGKEGVLAVAAVQGGGAGAGRIGGARDERDGVIARAGIHVAAAGSDVGDGDVVIAAAAVDFGVNSVSGVEDPVGTALGGDGDAGDAAVV